MIGNKRVRKKKKNSESKIQSRQAGRIATRIRLYDPLRLLTDDIFIIIIHKG
jgi:hypothetical protein